jgi:hypothetical protein
MDGAQDPSDFWAKLKYKDDDPSTGEIVAWHPLLAATSAEWARRGCQSTISPVEGSSSLYFSLAQN